MRFLFLFFITIPILEMWILIEVGSSIGALSTIFLVFITATIGLALLRQQGLETLFRVNQKLEHGELPASEILAGLMLAIGGALLLTPGFITDIFGFACLLPGTRRLLVASLLKRGVIMAQHGENMSFSANFDQFDVREPSRSSRTGGYGVESQGETIDGEFKRD